MHYIFIPAQEIQHAMLMKSADVELTNNLGEDYKLLTDPDSASLIADKLDDMNKNWDNLQGMILCPYDILNEVVFDKMFIR